MSTEYVYIRKLNAQELGFRKGEPKKAGRYIYISKDYLSYFPALSTVIRNDHVIIDVIPPSLNQIVLTNFVYHNDKIIDKKPNGRDEFRLYLNEGNDPGRDYFQPEDIIAIHRFKMENGNVVYKMYLFPAAIKGDEYERLEKLLKDKGIYDSHALLPISDMPFIALSRNIDSSTVVVPDDVKEAVLTEEISLIPDEEMKKEFEFTNLIRESAFRDLLLYFYDFRCAVTGTIIRYDSLNNLEAAHIIPDELRGPAHPKNGLPLNRDMHWAFDKGFFTVNDKYEVIVHEKVKNNEILSKIHGKKIILPEDSRARPSSFSLNWHKDNIFGVFTRSI